MPWKAFVVSKAVLPMIRKAQCVPDVWRHTLATFVRCLVTSSHDPALCLRWWSASADWVFVLEYSYDSDCTVFLQNAALHSWWRCFSVKLWVVSGYGSETGSRLRETGPCVNIHNQLIIKRKEIKYVTYIYCLYMLCVIIQIKECIFKIQCFCFI
jgi:hypothetical protein